MNLIKNLLMAAIIMASTNLFAGNSGGDDAGNGGFAFKQSIKILKMATDELEEKIQNSTLKDLVDHPEWRVILQDTLLYENIRKIYLWNHYRDGKKLSMDYEVKPARVFVLKSYYEAFSGKTDSELEDASLEVQKRLLHEAAHIWGYNEVASEKFSNEFLENAKGEDTRPNDITIGSFCSCLKGKSDLISNCGVNFCATKPVTDFPVLYVNTIIGAATSAHSKLGNLYNWCTKQLNSDVATPHCVLNVTDGSETFNLPVNIKPDSNSFSANIKTLAKDRTYLLKLVESKNEPNAQSKEFQLRRQSPPKDPTPVGNLKVAPINQYSCLMYGGKVDSTGSIIRTNFVRQYYYFTANETPAPIPPAGANHPSLTVCHDEQVYPGNDSAQFERLELIPNLFSMWDKNDIRFIARPQDGGKLYINKILEDRLASEYDIEGVTISLFTALGFPSRPSAPSSIIGYMMLPFTDADTGKSFCPSYSEYNGNQPLFNLLGEYMGETEGLYLAEREPETIQDGSTYKTFYGSMFVRESVLLNYAFYMENGLKLKPSSNMFHTKTLYYYWPIDPSADPVMQGNRKLFTVRSPWQMNGQVPTGIDGSIRTSDKRIGCVSKSY